ncbi:peptidase S9, prolyl oligopeptidase active site domain protein [Rhodopirellula sp. SWK7]|nr:peptidase S9, prolyl oligopeptidase active site domain protein [Rhodopirellula sp. SWK7]
MHLAMSSQYARLALVLIGAVITATSPSQADAANPGTASRTTNLRLTPHWIDDDRFWFERETRSGETEVVTVDAATGELTVQSPDEADDSSKGARSGRSTGSGFRGGIVPRSGSSDDDAEIEFVNKSDKTVQTFWVDGKGDRVAFATLAPGETKRQHTYISHAWEVVGDDGTYFGSIVAEKSKTRAEIEKTFTRRQRRPSRRNRQREPIDDRVATEFAKLSTALREIEHQGEDETDDEETDKAASGAYELVSPRMSPDGKVLAAWRLTPAAKPTVYTIESSPAEGGRAKLNERAYALPGDEMDRYDLVAWNVDEQSVIKLEIPTIDFGRPRIRWHHDHQMLIQKVDRGHQRFRLFLVDPIANRVDTPIDETTDTFIWSAHAGKVPLVTYLEDGDEVIYASEMSGYRHLYLVDLTGQNEMQPITKGDYLVRELIHVDEKNRLIDLVVGEYHDDQDPYHQHLIRVGMDDGRATSLTDGDGDHEYQFSPDRRYVIVNYSRVDAPPVHELRRTDDGSLVATLATAERIGDAGTTLLPTRFSAKGRDGETDIWGIICFPENYDPNSKTQYPVVEAIYAGPHDSHVPKRYRSAQWYSDMTSLGFIVVRIDGMGTANRSKAFHDVCWHNLKDAGFPDRIAWMKTAAKQFPAMDLTRVGIYGTSAGGQNACGALLFHGDFYDAAVASCGCHDNRMDKASWNEQWMGYPVGPHYAQSSNIDNAGNLKGDLLLLVGELDSNVPPESTLRLVDALIKEDKRFDFLMIPGMGHSDGGRYGKQLTRDFFVEKLKPEIPPSTESTRITAVDLSDIEPSTVASDATKLYQFDRDLLKRQLPIRIDPTHLTQMEHFLSAWQKAFTDLDSNDASELRQKIADDRTDLAKNVQSSQAWFASVPFAKTIIDLCEPDRRGTPVAYADVALTLEQIDQQLDELLAEPSESITPSASSPESSDRKIAKEIKSAFVSWRRFYSDYDPQFDWWSGDLAKTIEKKLEKWRPVIKHEVASKASHANGDMPSMFDTTYPDLDPYLSSQGSIMPGVMRRYRSELRDMPKSDRANWLNEWLMELESLSFAAKPFEQWSRGDQVDYHRLHQDIEYRLATSVKRKTPAVISKSADGSGIEGTVVGRDRLMLELRREFIDHTPEELIALAEQGYVECRKEMVDAAREMGFGDDWQAAVEKIKTMHVPVGQQPNLIRQTANDSIAWLRDADMLTVDRFAEKSWRMIMMTPQRQLVNPFFTGGEVISVSFPTRQMTADQQRQSLRGNNKPFARATVHHELIPGHHLQAFQTSRYQSHRAEFGTPFWLEGWAVYWEFLLYDDGFARTPEERLGFLVWRAHRYARILFSLRFHLGQLTPDQCVDFLVDNVGFDRINAEAEVRRSVGPDYPPLYQAAYMIGAMQLLELRDRYVKDGGTAKSFHDEVMKQGSLPISLLQAIVLEQNITIDSPPMWTFDAKMVAAP